jgi:hypothetical protein
VQETIVDVVTMSSTTATALGKTRSIDGAETSASSDTYTGKVALFTAPDLSLIENEAVDGDNDLVGNGGDGDGDVQIDELDNTAGLGVPLDTRVQAAATGLGLTPATDLATDFAALVVPVADGDTLTATYIDEDPVATDTDTADIDLTPPTISLVSPDNESYTSDQILQMQAATVVDLGAGIDSNDVTLTAIGTGAGSTSKLPIENGYRVTFVPSANMTEGLKEWYLTVKDMAGNSPAAGVDAPEGTADNKFEYTVDISGPVVTAAETGGEVDENGDVLANNEANDAVTVTLDLGTGGAPVNPDTIAVTDFQVGGVSPATITVDADGDKLLLEMATPLNTNAKPKVQLVGSISDEAGNSRTEGTIANATDKLAPVVSVTLAGEAASVPVSSTTVTIDVLSSEPAQTPLVQVNFLAQAGDGTLMLDATKQKFVAASSIGVNAWRAIVDIDENTGVAPAGTNGAMNVQVSVVDFAANTATTGVDDPDGTVAGGGVAGVILDDAVMLELDDELNGGVAPTGTNGGFQLSPNVGTAAEPEADVSSPFVTINLNGEATEYPVGAANIDVDTHGGATLLSATLEDENGAETDVMAQIDAIDSNSFSLATTGLALGEYTLTVTGQDEVGNFSTNSADEEPEEFTYTFMVVEKAPFDLSVKPGMNMVSLPMSPVSTDINDVFGSVTQVDLVVSYDPVDPAGPWLIAQRNATTGLFEGTLTDVDGMHGYWVRSNSFASADLDLPRQEYQQQIPRGEGLEPGVRDRPGSECPGYGHRRRRLLRQHQLECGLHLRHPG